MLSVTEYSNMVDEVLGLESILKELGEFTVDTSEGPYKVREQLLADTIPEQKAYNKLKAEYLAKKRIIEGYDTVARYELAMKNKGKP